MVARPEPDVTELQSLVTRLYALLGSMDSYDHFGHGFHFFDPAVMQEMEQKRVRLVEQVNETLSAWRRDDPERVERWIVHNEAVLRTAIQRFEAMPNKTSGYHIQRCHELLARWSAQRDQHEFSVPLQHYWGLGVEGF